MDFEKKSIIVADDSKNFIIYTGIILKRMGFNVIPASNGVEVLKLLKQEQADVVMLDVLMPELDGPSTLKYMKETPSTSNIPVIMVTMDMGKQIADKCRDLGCSSFLRKPITVDSLHEAIQDSLLGVLGRKRKHMRAPYVGKVSLTHNGKPHDLYSETLAEGGVYIRKNDPLPVGSEVELRLPVGTEILKLKGVVIYVKSLIGDKFKIPPGMAVEFKDIPEDYSYLLKSFITDLLARDVIDSQEENIIADHGGRF